MRRIAGTVSVRGSEPDPAYTPGSMFSSWISDEENAGSLHSGHVASAQYFSKICFAEDNLIGGEGDLA